MFYTMIAHVINVITTIITLLCLYIYIPSMYSPYYIYSELNKIKKERIKAIQTKAALEANSRMKGFNDRYSSSSSTGDSIWDDLYMTYDAGDGEYLSMPHVYVPTCVYLL